MWLASVSHWSDILIPKKSGPIVPNNTLRHLAGLGGSSVPDKRPILTSDYSQNDRNKADRMLDQLLRGVGDKRWGRFFRMNLTYCLHRGLSDDEIAGLPELWHMQRARDIDGGPVEVFWSRGVAEGAISAEPCVAPQRQYITPEIWLPIDCGECPPCLARKFIMDTGQPCTSATYCKP